MAQEEGDKLEATGTLGPPDPSLVCAFEGPAPYANRIFLSVTPVLGRLSFVEEPIGLPAGATPQFRAAVTLSIADLVSLKTLLDRMLMDVQKVSVEGAPDA